MASYGKYPNTEEHCPMTKPTGRPRGRPKTKEYTTLMARVDVALADQVKHYAALHRQPLSVVIRDALTLLMEEYPSGADLTGPHRVAAHEFLSDRYESPLDTLVGETDSAGLAELLSDTNNFAVEKIMSDTNRGAGYMSDTNENDKIISDTKEVPDIVSDMKADYDTTKYFLGGLCRQGHNWHGTGKSLRRQAARADRQECLECQRFRTARKRQTQPA
jgi:hypothetical protein